MNEQAIIKPIKDVFEIFSTHPMSEDPEDWREYINY